MTRFDEQARDWRALGIVAGLHGLAAWALLNQEPVVQTQEWRPLMVSLLTVDKSVPPPEMPRPQPTQPRMQPIPAPRAALPVIAERVDTPTPTAQPTPQAEQTPLPEALPVAETATPVATAAAPAPVPAAIEPPRFDADYLENPAPVYPALSIRSGEHGHVLLRVLVNPDGGAAQVEVRQSSGYKRLDKAARDTVQRWRFVPARQGDKGVAAWVLVPISFSLRS